MEKQTFTLLITSESAIQKLESLGRKKGEYVTRLIEADIRLEQLEREVKALKDRIGGV
jgi:hypothetical protein